MLDTLAIKKSFSQAAPVYDAQAQLQHRVRQQCIALARNYWAADTHILDAGCGTGALMEETYGWNITGLDIAPGMCEVARKKGGIVINADATAMPFADGYFGGVFSSLMLQWANTPLGVFSEMVRICKPKAHCVISTLTNGTLYELREAFAMLDETPHVSTFLQPEEIIAYAQEAGYLVTLAEEKSIIERYPDAFRLMRSLKAIGAGNKQLGRQRGMMTPQQLARLESGYGWRFGGAEGLPATWNMLYLVLEKK
jgi:malonyl-CoA O-methyltransferase